MTVGRLIIIIVLIWMGVALIREETRIDDLSGRVKSLENCVDMRICS